MKCRAGTEEKPRSCACTVQNGQFLLNWLEIFLRNYRLKVIILRCYVDVTYRCFKYRKSVIKKCKRVGTLIVPTIYLQLIQNRYMFRSFTVLQCSHQHCVQPVASDVDVVGYL